MSEITQIELPDGEVIWARVSGQPRPRDVRFGENVMAFAADEFSRLASSVIGTVRDAVSGHGADEITIDFGVELSAKSGRVIGVLAELGATSSIAVHLTFRDKATEGGSAERESASQPGEPRATDA